MLALIMLGFDFLICIAVASFTSLPQLLQDIDKGLVNENII